MLQDHGLGKDRVDIAVVLELCCTSGEVILPMSVKIVSDSVAVSSILMTIDGP
jgi:hypothetical protein